MTKLIQVIYTEERRGDGSKGEPFRMVPQLWTIDGNLICESENNWERDGNGHFEKKVNHEVLHSLGTW